MRAISATLRSPRDPHQRLRVFDHRAIRHEDLGDRAPSLRAHGVHELHHFDDADDGVLLHLGPDLDEGGAPGFGARWKMPTNGAVTCTKPAAAVAGSSPRGLRPAPAGPSPTVGAGGESGAAAASPPLPRGAEPRFNVSLRPSCSKCSSSNSDSSSSRTISATSPAVRGTGAAQRWT